MSKNPQPPRETVQESFEICFENFFTMDEMIKYMRDKHSLAQDKTEAVFDSLITRGRQSDSDYLEQSVARSLERQMLTQPQPWNREQKMSVLNHRISILPQETRDLVNRLSQLEKDTLSFFITREFVTKEGSPAYARTVKHPTCFHCHCFICYRTFYRILAHLDNREIIDRIMESLDIAAQRLRLEETRN